MSTASISAAKEMRKGYMCNTLFRLVRVRWTTVHIFQRVAPPQRPAGGISEVTTVDKQVKNSLTNVLEAYVPECVVV